MNKLLWGIAAGIALLIFWPTAPKDYGAGVVAPLAPLQQTLSLSSFKQKDYQITPVASFYIKAKVLDRENYYFGREADLSPVDFVLGWGPMSDQDVLSHISISQRNRWYYWKTDEWIISRKAIENSSANMHMIPSNDSVASALKQVKQGDVITLSGKLVNVKGQDGWQWNSSLSRNDTGDGACELIWVESIRVH